MGNYVHFFANNSETYTLPTAKGNMFIFQRLKNSAKQYAINNIEKLIALEVNDVPNYICSISKVIKYVKSQIKIQNLSMSDTESELNNKINCKKNIIEDNKKLQNLIK